MGLCLSLSSINTGGGVGHRGGSSNGMSRPACSCGVSSSRGLETPSRAASVGWELGSGLRSLSEGPRRSAKVTLDLCCQQQSIPFLSLVKDALIQSPVLWLLSAPDVSSWFPPPLFLFPHIPIAQRASQGVCRATAWQGMGSVLEPGFGVWV